MLILENGGVLGEDRTFLGLFDIRLDGHHPFAATLVEDFIEQSQHVEVEGFVEAMAENELRNLGKHLLHHRQIVGHEKGSQRRTADDDDLEGMPQGSDRTT